MMNSPRSFSIYTIQRLKDILEDDTLLVRIFKSNDVAIICPWYIINKNININFSGDNDVNAQEEVKFEKGKLVVPIVETKDEVKCYVPCGGLNEDDTVPYCVVDWKLDSFGINVPLQTYNDDKGNWANVVKDQEISDGDIVKVRNNFYEVLG